MIGPSLIHGDVAYIPLSQGFFAEVDTSDFAWLSQWKWMAQRINARVYATRNSPRVKGKRCGYILMHRVILGAPAGVEVDHRVGVGLGNRRFNLRLATKAQNLQNSRKRRDAETSRHKGVCRQHRR